MSILFIGLSIFALIGSFLMFNIKKNLPTSPSEKVEVVATEPQAETKTICRTTCQKIGIVFRCLIEPRMLLLIVYFINNGYAQVLVSTQVTRQIQSVKLVGLAMAVFAIVEVLTTGILAQVSDKAGHFLIGVIGLIAEVLACVSTYYMNEYQSWLVYLPPVFFAVMDTVYQTECMSIVGRFFDDELENAASTYRLIQGIGSSICSYVTPLFVSQGASASTPSQLIAEMAVALILALVGYILLCVFLILFKKPKDIIPTPEK